MSALTDTLRSVAQLIDDAVRYGLPEPSSINVNDYAAPTLILAQFEEVEAWANYLQGDGPAVLVERYANEETEFIGATADASDVYGIHIRVTTNRPVATEVPA